MDDNQLILLNYHWKYMKIYDLQILVALQKDDNQTSLFNSTPIDPLAALQFVTPFPYIYLSVFDPLLLSNFCIFVHYRVLNTRHIPPMTSHVLSSMLLRVLHMLFAQLSIMTGKSIV